MRCMRVLALARIFLIIDRIPQCKLLKSPIELWDSRLVAFSQTPKKYRTSLVYWILQRLHSARAKLTSKLSFLYAWNPGTSGVFYIASLLYLSRSHPLPFLNTHTALSFAARSILSAFCQYPLCISVKLSRSRCAKLTADSAASIPISPLRKLAHREVL